MKKFTAIFTITLSLAVVSSILFVNNVVAVYHWWKAFLAVGGDSALVTAHSSGFASWLDWSVVDYSAVTTFIPALGFAAIVRSLWAVRRGQRVRSEDFPFFRGSDQLNVALGLFGTLWGIIVIGYFKLDTVSMADLMQCLHTALFSTLMAVVWVFMIDRPLLRPLLVKWLESTGQASTDDGDLVAAVTQLTERLGAASDAFDERQRTYEEAFAKRQAEIASIFAKNLQSMDASLKDSLQASAASLQNQLQASEAAFQKSFQAKEAALQERLKTAEAAFADRQQRYEAEFARRQTAYEESLEHRLQDYRQGFEAQQREYVEVFTKRLEALEAEKEAAQQKAASVSKKLSAVMSALS